MSVVDLFSGAGGFSEGFSQAGFKIAAAFDNWQLALDSHKANHPQTKHINKNIQDVKTRELEKFKADIILGSPPCQQFSVANNTPDVEKGLELTNIFLELIADLNPRFWIMENVTGVLKHIKGRIINLGGRNHILNAVNYGTPQIRKRVFCGKFPFPQPTHVQFPQINLLGKKLHKWQVVADVLKDVQLPENENLQMTKKGLDRALAVLQKEDIPYRTAIISGDKPSHTLIAHIGLDYTGGIIDTSFYDRHGSNFFPLDKPSPVITTKMGRLHLLKQNLRRLSSVEAKILMGFPKDYTILGESVTVKFRQIGNAVCPPVAKAIAKEIKEGI